jgi:hypothetical protein
MSGRDGKVTATVRDLIGDGAGLAVSMTFSDDFAFGQWRAGGLSQGGLSASMALSSGLAVVGNFATSLSPTPLP